MPRRILGHGYELGQFRQNLDEDALADVIHGALWECFRSSTRRLYDDAHARDPVVPLRPESRRNPPRVPFTPPVLRPADGHIVQFTANISTLHYSAFGAVALRVPASNGSVIFGPCCRALTGRKIEPEARDAESSLDNKIVCGGYQLLVRVGHSPFDDNSQLDGNTICVSYYHPVFCWPIPQTHGQV